MKTTFHAFFHVFILLCLIICAFPVSADTAKKTPLEKVSLQLKWLHAFQFAGYYAAKEKGFYAAEGLDVDIKARLKHLDNVEQVVKGDSNYGVADSNLLLDRLKGKPVVVLASIFQHCAAVYVSLKSSGIVSPYEFKGKRVMEDKDATSVMGAPLQAMRYEVGIANQDFTRINLSFNLDDLINGKTDVMPAYLTDVGYYFREKHVDINIIDPRNYGIDFLGDNLFTTEQEISLHPERVQHFLRASLQGWDYALKHPEEIVQLIMKKYNSDKRLSAGRLRSEAVETTKLILPDSIPLGSSSIERFQRVAEIYQQLGLAKSLDKLSGFIYQQDISNKLKLSAEEKNWLQSHPVIRLGIDKGFSPYDFINDKGQYSGLSADFIEKIEQQLGVKFEIIQDKPWSQMLAMAKRGEIDLLSSVNKTPERSQYLDFTEVYLEMPTTIVNLEKQGFIGGLENLQGKTVAVENGYYTQEWLKKNHPDITLISVDNTLSALTMVNTEQADAYVGDALSTNYAIRQHGMINLHFTGDGGEKNRLRLGIPKKNSLLRDILNKALNSIPDAEKQTILNRWTSLQIKQTLTKQTLLQYGFGICAVFVVIMLWNMSLQREIKRRQQTEKALRESETAFRNLFEDSYDPILLLKAGRFIDCNTATFTQLGYRSKTEFINCRPDDISPTLQPDGRYSQEKGLEMINTALQKGYHRFDWLYLCADGSSFQVEVSLTAMTMHNEPVIHVCWRDITERKLTEQARIESDLRWKFAIEGAGDGVWDWNIQSDEAQYSKLWKSMLGYSEEDILPTNDEWKNRIHPEDRDYVANTMQAYLQGKSEIYVVEYRLKCKDDSYKWILGRGMVVSRDEDGKPLRMIGTHTDITERKQAEAALQKSEEQLKLVLEGGYIGFWDWNILTGKVERNAIWAQMLGYTYEEVNHTVKQWLDFIHPDDRDQAQQSIVDVLAGRKRYHKAEYRMLHKDGSLRWILDHACIVQRDSQGNPVRMSGTHTDISERKKAEKLLEINENKYRTLVELAGDAIFLADANSGIILDCNLNATKLIGKSKEEIIGFHQSELHPPEKLELYKKLFAESAKSGKDIIEDVFVIHKDGHTIPVEIRANVFELDGTRVLLGAFRDVTNRRRAETELRIAATVFESQEGMMITDENGLVIKVNQAFSSITGYNSSEIVGKNPRLLSSGQHSKEFYAYLWKNIHLTGIWQGEIWNRRKNGEIYPEWLTITAVKQNENADFVSHYVGTFVDISHHKKAELAMQEAELQAKRASQAKSEFLANMSHEIRTPLNGIIGMTKLALHTVLNSQQRNYLNKITLSSQYLLSLINNILDVSKIEAGKLELEYLIFSPNQLLNHLDDIINIQTAEQNIVVVKLVDKKTPHWLIGDTLRLEQILVNLVSNAVKFTEKGRIIVSVEPEEITQKNVRLRFSVQDSGIGMTSEQIAGLFQAFSQADSSITRRYGGTGLGLRISKGLVELMGGEITVSSTPKQGSTFSFSVPLAISETPPRLSDRVRLNHKTQDASCLNGYKVLLVEDNDINRELATEWLNDLGIEVEIAENGREGVNKVFSAPFDLVIMDVQMPEMDGLTATRIIRSNQQYAKLPIIAMTANAMAGDREATLTAGMNDYLAKPVELEKLTELLIHWLGDSSSSPTVISRAAKQKKQTNAVIALPKQLPPFDMDAALRLVKNNSQLLYKLLIMFHKQYADAVPKLEILISKGQYLEAKRLAHTLKGVSGQLALKDLAEAATVVERAINSEHSSALPDLIAALNEHLTPALQAVKSLDNYQESL